LILDAHFQIALEKDEDIEARESLLDRVFGLERIQKTSEKYPKTIGDNYKIYAFVNNKERAQQLLQGNRMSKEIKKKIQTNNSYHVMGMEELETSFQRFKTETENMPWEYFERTFIKRYSQLSRLTLTLGQMSIVNTTYTIILKNLKLIVLLMKQKNIVLTLSRIILNYKMLFKI
jgi:hypothetical protein